MTRKYIHRLASLISESVYDDLEDADEFKQPESDGYGCGPDCWEYEGLPLLIDGQTLLSTATIKYETDETFYKGYPGSYTSPPEEDQLDVTIKKSEVESFEIFDQQGNIVVKWYHRAGEKTNKFTVDNPYGDTTTWEAGFAVGNLPDLTLINVLEQIKQEFEGDEEEVIEYLQENYAVPEEDPPDPRDWEDDIGRGQF